jgi:hypothetical protein
MLRVSKNLRMNHQEIVGINMAYSEDADTHPGFCCAENTNCNSLPLRERSE